MKVDIKAGRGNMVRVEFSYGAPVYEPVAKIVASLPQSRWTGEYWVTFRRHLLRLVERLEAIGSEPILHDELQDYYSSEVARIAALEQPPQLDSSPLDVQLKIPLKPFQNIGAKFLMLGNKILADEMRVGKTSQAFVGAIQLMRLGLVTRTLIVCPSKVKKEWANQIQDFTDASYIVITGTPKQRLKQLENAKLNQFTIINYEKIMARAGNDFDGPTSRRRIYIPSTELKVLMDIGYDLVVFDEATYAMNYKSFRTVGANKLARKAKYVWGLTGTPLMNELRELYNVVRLVDPHFFDMSWPEFEREYTNAITGEPIAKKLESLHKKLQAIMLRRLRSEVMPELPPIVNMNRYVKMEGAQARLYAEAEHEFKVYLGQRLKDGTPAHLIIKGALARLTRLKQICAHPALLGDTKELQSYASSKLVLLKDILLNEIPKTEQIIVFTQFESLTRILEEELKEYNPLKIVGGMSEKNTDAAKMAFKTNPNHRIMLLTTAGGMGLDLKPATFVILYDQLYNPQMMEQIIARPAGHGQKDKISAMWLWTEGTIEENVWATLKRKKGLFSTVIDGKKEEDELAKKLTTEDIESWLK